MFSQFSLYRSPAVLFALMVLCSAQSAAGQSDDKKYYLNTYEVGDLILNIQDYHYSESLQRGPAPMPSGGMGGGMMGGGISDNIGPSGGRRGAGQTRPYTAILMNDLWQVIETTVSSSTWVESGGKGEIAPLGTSFVVWQTKEVHDLIDVLLTQLRKGSADRRTVTIDARWLLLNSDELDRLLGELKDEVPQQVDREVLAEFTRRETSIRALTNCVSGQLVYLVSGMRRNVVSSYIPVVGSVEPPDGGKHLASNRGGSIIRLVSDNPSGGRGGTRSLDGGYGREFDGEFGRGGYGEGYGGRGGRMDGPGVGYQPVIEKPIFGALLEIRPTLIHGLAEAVVDLRSTITVSAVPAEMHEMRRASTAPEVDRIAIETQEFATTLRLPLGKPVLVGGLTYAPASTDPTQRGEATGDAKEHPQLYLVLELR